MRSMHRARRGCLVDTADVEAAGFRVSTASRSSRRVVLHRRADGCWNVVDKSDLADLPADAQRAGISLAAAVVGGVGVVGRSVTLLEFDRDMRWCGVWRAGPRGRACRCEQRRDGQKGRGA